MQNVLKLELENFSNNFVDDLKKMKLHSDIADVFKSAATRCDRANKLPIFRPMKSVLVCYRVNHGHIMTMADVSSCCSRPTVYIAHTTSLNIQGLNSMWAFFFVICHMLLFCTLGLLPLIQKCVCSSSEQTSGQCPAWPAVAYTITELTASTSIYFYVHKQKGIRRRLHSAAPVSYTHLTLPTNREV